MRAFGIIGGGATLAFLGATAGLQFLAPVAAVGTLGNFDYILIDLKILYSYSQELLE